MSTDLKISQLTPATTVNTNDYTVMVDGNTSANKRATVAQILAIAGAGTVTSVNVSGANGINVSGAPITSNGTVNLSLGAITPTSIVASGTISGSNLSNTNTGDQAITLVGDVTASASTGTLTTTLANSVVTNDKMSNMVGPTVKGRTSGTGIPQDLSTAQITAMLPEMVADSGSGGTKGLVPPPTAGSAAAKKFLRADATWVATDLNDILPSQGGNSGKVLQTSGTTTSWQAVGVGSVTNVSVTTANGVSGTVATSTTTPAISLTLGAITPTSVNSVVVSGSSTPTLAVTGTTTVSGSNTGDQTTISGNAGTATKLATGRTIAVTGDLAYTSPSFDGSANVTAAGTLATVATAGTTGGSTAIPVVTINAKGLTTSITTAAVVAPAGTLSGNTLASGVTASSLTSLGTIANLTATAGTISTTPSASTDIANKLYVDTVAQGLDAKASCVAATTADITLTGTQTIDGIAIVAGNRVLVKNQTLSQNNGIYLCAAGAWTRTTDADTWDELTSAFTFIETGTVNADTGWVCTANAGGTLGTTALPWSQFSGAGSYTASTGLTLTGTAFSLTTPVAVANGGTGITSLGSGIATFLGTPSSANLASAVTDETGSGSLVFATSPTLVTPILGTPTSGTLTNCTFPTLNQNTTGTAAGLSATLAVASGGTGVTTSTGSGNNVLSTSPTITSPTITGGALNGTLGATTPSTVAATTGVFSGKGAFNGATNTHALNVRGATGFNLQVRNVSSALTLQSANDADSASVAMNFLGSSFVFLDDALVARATITSTGLNSTAIGATTPSTVAATTISSTTGANFATSSGSVGIGTASPTYKLSVSGAYVTGGIFVADTNASEASPVIRVQGNRSDNNGSQDFSGGLVLERLNSNGTTGLVSGNVLGTIYFGGNYNATPTFTYPASISAIADGNWSSTSTASTGLAFFTGATGQTLGTPNVAYGTERMRITSAGNVGIGAESPASILHLKKDGSGNGVSTTFEVNSGTNTNWRIGCQNNVNNGFEITPSTSAGGSTFSTPVVTVTTSGAAITGTLSTTGAVSANAGTFVTDSAGAIMGIGGTSTNNARLVINGSSANLYGSYLTFQRNSVNKWSIGTESGILGNNSDAWYMYDSMAGSPALKFTTGVGLAITGTLSATGAATFGTSSTSTTPVVNYLLGSSGAGGGANMKWSTNGVDRFAIATLNGVGGTATDALFYGYGTNGFYFYPSGTYSLGITSTGVAVVGALSKGSGSFRIEHPLPSKSATHQLVHSFIEGPKCDLIYRGKVDLVDGKASVNIDADSTMTEGTFEALCATVQCFTSNESGWGAIRGKVVGNILTIEAQDAASTDNVSWMVIGERKDKHIMDTDWTDKNGRPIVEPLKPAEPAIESK